MPRTYCMKCKLCEAKAISTNPDLIYCNECEQYGCMVRDYKSEAVSYNMAILRAAH